MLLACSQSHLAQPAIYSQNAIYAIIPQHKPIPSSPYLLPSIITPLLSTFSLEASEFTNPQPIHSHLRTPHTLTSALDSDVSLLVEEVRV